MLTKGGNLLELSQLKYLNLSRTKITDAGLRFLTTNAQFKDSLEYLLLDGCLGISSSETLATVSDGRTKSSIYGGVGSEVLT